MDCDEKECREKHTDICRTIEKKMLLQAEVLNTKIDAIKEAITIQTSELDRRLDILNGHQAELKADRDQFVREDRYNDRMKLIEAFIETAKKDIGKLDNYYAQRFTAQNKFQIVTTIIASLAVILSIFFHYAK